MRFFGGMVGVSVAPRIQRSCDLPLTKRSDNTNFSSSANSVELSPTVATTVGLTSFSSSANSEEL